MISFIKGELADIKENYIVLECNNIGYEIFLPASAIMELPPRKSTVKIYTYLHVKEDGLSLYGFLTRDDLEMFKLLITVNGIGPKGALGILSGITADEIRFAILAEDTRTLAKAPGIGAKTAGKIILELRDKLKLEEAFEQKLKNEAGRLDSGSIYGKREDAISALMAMGYSSSEAYRIVTQIEITDDMSTEDIIKLCLKKI